MLKYIPLSLIIISIAIIWTTAYAISEISDYLQWVLVGTGFLILTNMLYLLRKTGISSAASLEEQKAIEAREKALKDAEIRYHKRQSELMQRLITYHEWLEFEEDTEISEPDTKEIISDWRRQDREVFKLLQKRTESLFDKIKNNKYHDNGIFQKNLLFNDIGNLIESVARIYKPDSENPLLETSIEKLLRAINRVAIQLLVLLDQLPLDLKDYNLKNTYKNIQTGVKAYGVYKSAESFMPFARPVYYLGRYALGATPATLGAGWAVTEILKRGTQQLSSHLANQYAMNLLHDMVFIIGNEAAGIFGGDFRHREIHWIYGAELTELMSRFPISREMLLYALNEVGSLQLRSEYDRIFLYRCLAAHKTAHPEKFEAQVYLSTPERQHLASRLEKFVKAYIQGSQKELAAWRSDAEDRIGVKIYLSTEDFSRSQAPDETDLRGFAILKSGPEDIEKSDETKAAKGLCSLAGFLLDIKQRHPHELPALLSETCMAEALDAEYRSQIFQKIEDEPPMIFDYPNLDPSDKLLDDYFNDLMTLAVRIFPLDARGDLTVKEAGDYFRKDTSALQKQLDQIYTDFLAEKILPDSPEKKIKPYIARHLLACLQPEESKIFLYKDILIEDEADGTFSLPPTKQLWLMGTDHRLLVLAVSSRKRKIDEGAIVVWSSMKKDAAFRLERVENRFSDDCRLKGGVWHWKEAIKDVKNPVLRISGKKLIRYESYFQLLI